MSSCKKNSADTPVTRAVNYDVTVDAKSFGSVIPNVVSNINLWNMNKTFHNPQVIGDYNIFDFVEYVQFMTATGGDPNHTRDLFKNPTDKTVLDDYDFTRLIENCRGVISLGAKPHIKLGNVPYKLSENFKVNGMEANVLPPSDYNQYYKYIRAIIEALVKEFGKQEVLSWHWGVYTEYENRDWFEGYGTGASAEEEFCKIYDYSVQALIDVLGKDGLYVGAHSMTVTSGFWDEIHFVKHCANGTNWANGEKGSYITYLSASFYDTRPGTFTTGYDLPNTIGYLKQNAESQGLVGLSYGVDEGRILGATSGSARSDLLSRTTGYTYMAAYDARLYTQLIDAGASYFSSWDYLSRGLFDGNPSISYHVATNMHRMAGMSRAPLEVTKVRPHDKTEINGLAGVDPASGKVTAMVYNFSNSISYSDSIKVNLKLNTSLKAGSHTVTINKINDDCNWFDDWVKDREKLGITAKNFSWSPDDACSIASILSGSALIQYKEYETSKYEVKCKLTPVTTKIDVAGDGTASMECTLGGNNVWFVEIQ